MRTWTLKHDGYWDSGSTVDRSARDREGWHQTLAHANLFKGIASQQAPAAPNTAWLTTLGNPTDRNSNAPAMSTPPGLYCRVPKERRSRHESPPERPGVPDGPGLKVTACRLLKEAERRGLLQARVRQILGRWEIDIGSVIDEMKEVRAGTRPSKRIVHKDKAGRVTGTEEIYDSARRLTDPCHHGRRLHGHDEGWTPVSGSPRLLGRAIPEHEELRKQEMAEGRVPLGLRMVRARAEAMDRPIKELRAALEAEATPVGPSVPPPSPRGPSAAPVNPLPRSPAGAGPASCPACGSPRSSP